jgi:hypothetical protein
MALTMHRASTIALGLLALTAGCEEKKPPPAATTAAAPPPATTGAATSAVSPASTAAPSTPPSGESATNGIFHVVAQGHRVVIYRLGDAGIVDTGAFYAVLGDGPVEQDPFLFRSTIEREGGKTVMTEVEPLSEFSGAWPGQAWAKRSDGTVKRTGDFWVKTDPLREGELLLDITPLDQKRALAAIRMDPPDIRFTLVGSSAGGVIAAPGKPTADQEGCAVRMDPVAGVKLAGLPSGHLFAFGLECKTYKVIAERWKPATVRGEVDVIEIEGARSLPQAVAVASPDEAYAFLNGGKLATWDGKAWKTDKGPGGSATTAWVSGDGVAWVVTDAGLFKHPKGGSWTQVDAGGVKIQTAWAKDEKTIWAATEDGVLMRSGPPPSAVLKLPSTSDVQAALTRDRRFLATAACKRTFVMLTQIAGDKAPTTYAPLTDAVKGNAELTSSDVQYLVEDVGGTLWVSAKVPSVAIAEKLVAAFTAKNKAKPLVFCHEPLIVKGPLKVE